MTPANVNGKPAFPTFHDSEIEPIVIAICQKFRIVRPLADSPRFYMLTSDYHLDPANDQIIYDHLQCWWLGDADFKVWFDALLSDKKLTEKIYQAYRAYRASQQAQQLSAKSHPKWLLAQFEFWIASGYGILDDEPMQLSHDPMQYCMAYIDDSLIVPGPMVSWENFMSQMGPADRPIFASFIWAAMDESNFGRQVMYLYDNGLTGKSDMTSAVTETIPQIAIGISSKDFDSQFFFSTVFGRRLVIVPDCHYPKIVKNDRVKMLTGNESATVEKKYQTPFSHNVYARVLVASNFAPEAETYRTHETSRLIIIKMDHNKCTSREHYDAQGKFVGNNNFRRQLKEELYHFLHYARDCYATICPSHRELIVPDMVTNSAVSDYEDIFRGVLADYLTVTKDPADIIYVNDMYDHLENFVPRLFRRNDNKFLAEWKAFMESEGVIYVKMGKARRRVYRGIRKRDPSTDSNVSMISNSDVVSLDTTLSQDVDISSVLGDLQ